MQIGKNSLKKYRTKESEDFWKANYDRCLNDETFEVFSSIKKTDGSRFFKCLLKPIKDQNNSIYAVMVTCHDITDLRQSEIKFRAIFEQAGGYCMLLDPNTKDGIPRIIDANKSACLAHGYTRKEFIGRTVADLDDQEGKGLAKKRTSLIMSGEDFSIENIHVRKDGSTFPVSISAKRIDIEGSSPIILTTEYDITERINAEQALISAKNKAEESDQLKTEFIHNMSHRDSYPDDWNSWFFRVTYDSCYWF